MLIFISCCNQMEKLKNENQRLRIECELMTKEVDMYHNGTGEFLLHSTSRWAC